MFKTISTLEEYKDKVEYVYARKDDKLVEIPKHLTYQDEKGNTMYIYESEYGAITCFSENEVTDKLEKLFDAYVLRLDLTQGNKPVIGTVANIKNYPDLMKIYYGAIYTNIGLIYVAKMNANGEWEAL